MPLLKVQGHDLFYSLTPAEADSTPKNVTILFIHGLGSSHSYYASMTPSLAQQGYACLAFDTPGSALSAHRGEDVDAETIAAIAGDLLSALKLDSKRIVAVGHSMGAIVVSELALRFDLLGAVMIGPVNPSDALFDARIEMVQSGGMEAVAKWVPSVATGPKATATHKAFIRALLLAQTAEGYMSLCRTIARAPRPRYADMGCPLLIVAGSHDKTCPLSGSEAILASWGVDENRKRLVVLDGVGHWHCVEAAEEVLEQVAGFANKVAAEAT
ncbi:alpha/beta hydrolase fold family protein [Drechmeria coniospora]|uniref:Alpha/beta hydrolase fold family protein n=1 Tax=Drechmeria coniospora TaxID=98403 RepID=A0A151GAK1_DRECN|nr:alpha/beta hydrolase fold family protein [Drechmeria coniospora]KYK54105.1 alpha/beta hydrolase fold family protein [Drechmeria coniospora]